MNSKRAMMLESTIKKMVSKYLTEASEVQFSNLPRKQQDIAKQLQSIMGIPIVKYFDGIHGYVVTFKKTSPHGGQLEAQTLKKLVALDIRWIGYAYEAWSIGF